MGRRQKSIVESGAGACSVRISNRVRAKFGRAYLAALVKGLKAEGRIITGDGLPDSISAVREEAAAKKCKQAASKQSRAPVLTRATSP